MHNDGMDSSYSTFEMNDDFDNDTLSSNIDDDVCDDVHPSVINEVLKEIKENRTTRDKHIETLRKLVLENEDLSHSRTDDIFLLRFLRARKYDVPKAFQVLKKYYAKRSRYPQLYTVVRPSILKFEHNYELATLLPHRDQFGRRVVIVNLERWNPKLFSMVVVFQACILFLEHMVNDEITQVCGVVCIVDGNISLYHALNCSPVYVKLFAQLTQDFPMRFKALHVMNASTHYNVLFNILKMILPIKLKNRIFIHGQNLKSLHQHISPNILPADYGGEQPALNYSECLDFMIEDEDRFLESIHKTDQNVNKL